jgi:ABC-type branched-subunit amino acid transport system substrate-binding protein
LSGRYAPLGRQAAAGLEAWAGAAGARLRLEDDRSEPERSAALALELAPRADLLFGPYGSGCGRAVAEAMAARPEVVWNHGAAAVERTGARMADVLGPARSYWRGLPAALGGDGLVAVVRCPGGFGAEIAAGASHALEAAGAPPVARLDLDPADPGAVVAAARASGARWIAGGGRMEDDLALARAALAAGLRVALVVMGVAIAGRELGPEVAGCLGPVQWDGDRSGWPFALPPDADYPAAQAAAAGMLAERALAEVGGGGPDALWDAARALRTATPLGPFALDAEGRQTAHAPAIVRWEDAPGGPLRRVAWRPASPGGVADSAP